MTRRIPVFMARNIKNLTERLTALFVARGWDSFNAGLFVGFLKLVLPLVAVIVLTVFVLAGIDSCRSRRTEKKIDRIESNVIEKKVEANVLTNAKQEIKATVNALSENTSRALEQVNRARQTRPQNATSEGLEKKAKEIYPE
jgi:outer membrane murein-binding lipoprotein Lpp